MKSVFKFIGALITATILLLPASYGQERKFIAGGAAIYPSKNIIEYAANSKQYTTFVAAIKAAGLADTLSGGRSIYTFRSCQSGF